MSVKIVEVRELKKGNYIVIDNEPCKIVDMSSSKPGKHGAAKVRIESFGLFDNKKHSLLTTGSDKAEVPIIERRPHQVLSISGNMAQLMNMETYETLELLIPEDMKEKVQEGGEIQIMEALGKKSMVE
ncbi:MAG: translation initiation factor IF-5A [Candidatus Altiarchaeota archaeon]|nr:translation initiation factor IF-5A [Candidatus Altiarchaeota archaeon]